MDQMTNIPEIVLLRIQKEIGQLLAELENTIHWSEDNLKKESKTKTTQQLKGARRKLKRIKHAITQRPSAALFGESQVGKSYLIKTFLSDADGDFKINDSEGDRISFLSDINPVGGGVESTSVVCRFSTQVNTPDKAFPLVGKLMTVKEIILVLCDTYFNDVKNHEQLPTGPVIDEKVEQLEDFFATSNYHQDYLNEDDVYDIKEYLEENFKSYTTSLVGADHYWDTLARLVNRIDDQHWFLALGLIFGNNNHIESIFKKLIEALKDLDYAEEIYLEFAAVLRKHGTILNVARLRELNGGNKFVEVSNKNDAREDVLIAKKNNGVISRGRVNKSVLCALLAEITFKVDGAKEKELSFLKNSDLLDFPGAQPRLENNEKDIVENHISEMVLRGKVGYLFNKYSTQYLINNLLLCHHNRDLKAKSIASLLNTWIANFIGDSPERREEFLRSTPVAPLFKIFTFFNVDLAYDQVNDTDAETYDTKWTKRLHTIFEEQIVNSASYDWNRNWSVSEPYFKNNYLLRDFHHSQNIFTHGGEPVEEKDYNHENVKEGYYEKVKESFVKSKLVKRYFKSPEDSWDAAATPRNDGSDLILANLSKVSTNTSKTKKFVNDTNVVLGEIIQEISRHFHSKNADEQIVQANKHADKIKLSLDMIFGPTPTVFGKFVKCFTIRESEVYEFYRQQLNSISRKKHRNFNEYVAIRNNCQHLSIDASYEANMAVLLKTYTNFSNQEEVEQYFASKEINLNFLFYGDDTVNIKNNSQILAEGLIDFWFETKFKVENFEFILRDGKLQEDSLLKLFDNIRVSCKKHAIHDIIANEIRDYVDRIEHVDEMLFMIADISAGIINKYFNSMGWDFLGEEEKNRIFKANEANNLALRFQRLENKLSYDSNENIADLFDQMRNYNEELSKTPPNSEVINRYPNFWNYNRWSEQMKISFIANCDIPTYDIRANKKLGDLIDGLKTYHFEVPDEASADIS